MAGVGLVLQIRQNDAPQFEDVQLAFLLEKNLASGSDQHGERDSGLPVRVKRSLQRICVLGSELQVAAGSVLRLKNLHDAGLFVRQVCRHRDQIEITVTEHAIGNLEIGKFFHAGSAPGVPKVDRQYFLCVVGSAI